MSIEDYVSLLRTSPSPSKPVGGDAYAASNPLLTD